VVAVLRLSAAAAHLYLPRTGARPAGAGPSTVAFSGGDRGESTCAQRQTAAVVDAGRLDSLRVARSVLEARRTELIERVRNAESRQVLENRAAELGLRAAVDSEIVILTVTDTLSRQ
jgi:hypothetical protein